MKQDYEDIRSQIPDPPVWWDENGVPRWCGMEPSNVADIYAVEVAFAEIACQSCHRRFYVAFSYSSIDATREYISTMKKAPALPLKRSLFANKEFLQRVADRTKVSVRIEESSLHYGDPPNVNCCPGGPTMTSDIIRVHSFWTKDKSTSYKWQRDPEYEVAFDP